MHTPEEQRDDDLEVNVTERWVRRGGQAVEMTPREWYLIEALAWRAGLIWADAELGHFLDRCGAASSRNAIRIHLCNIRRKLGWSAIQTIPGRGYRVLPASLNGAR